MINKAVSFSELQFPLSSEEIRLLAELGFAAINAGYIAPALGIFYNLRVLRPEHAIPFIGIAISHMALGAFDEAIACLSDAERVVTVERDDLRLYLGLAYALSGNLAAADQIFLGLSEGSDLQDEQRFFLSTMLQKKHLLAKASTWPIPAKVSLKHPQLAGSCSGEASENDGSAKNEDPFGPLSSRESIAHPFRDPSTQFFKEEQCQR